MLGQVNSHAAHQESAAKENFALSVDFKLPYHWEGNGYDQMIGNGVDNRAAKVETLSINTVAVHERIPRLLDRAALEEPCKPHTNSVEEA